MHGTQCFFIASFASHPELEGGVLPCCSPSFLIMTRHLHCHVSEKAWHGCREGAAAIPAAAVCYAGASLFVPSTASIFNEWALKRQMDTSLHLQNFYLYVFGLSFNSVGLLLAAILSGRSIPALFHGHSKVRLLMTPWLLAIWSQQKHEPDQAHSQLLVMKSFSLHADSGTRQCESTCGVQINPCLPCQISAKMKCPAAEGLVVCCAVHHDAGGQQCDAGRTLLLFLQVSAHYVMLHQ